MQGKRAGARKLGRKLGRNLGVSTAANTPTIAQAVEWVRVHVPDAPEPMAAVAVQMLAYNGVEPTPDGVRERLRAQGRMP